MNFTSGSLSLSGKGGWTGKIAAGVLVFASLVVYVYWGIYLPLQAPGYDFTGPYEAAYALAHHASFQVYDLGQQRIYNNQVLHLPAGPSEFRWPPQMGALLLPFGLLPYTLAHLLWLLGCQIALVISLWLLARCIAVSVRAESGLLARLRSPWVALLVIGCAAAWCQAVTDSLRLGQSTLWLLLGCALLLYGEIFQRQTWAAAGLALAILVKLFPALLLVYYLWRGRYRLCLITCALLAGLTAITLPITGTDWYHFFLAALQTYQGEPNAGPVNLSLYHALIVSSAALVQPGKPEPTSGLLVSLAQAACLALFAALLLRQGWPALLRPLVHRSASSPTPPPAARPATPPQALSRDERAALFAATAWAVCTVLLVEPIDWIFYYLLVLLPLASLLIWPVSLSRFSVISITGSVAWRWIIALLAALLASLPLLFDTRVDAPMSAGFIIGISIRPLAMLLVWCCLARETTGKGKRLVPATASAEAL
jgi:hypothetical protein